MDLTAQEESIIRMRFGIDGVDPMTLEEVGNVYGLTRERIRQIEMKALRKLRVIAKNYGITVDDLK